jgi:hypothetical protein
MTTSGPESMSPPPADAGPPVDGEMTAAVRAELARLGQSTSIPGAVALRLARALDDPALGHAQVASLSDKLMKVLEPLLRDGPRPPDEVDEFTRRLQEKAASA